MVLLHASNITEYKAGLPRRVEGTCCWILTHPQYLSWISNQDTRLLWITGIPGCGKTILSAYLTEHLDTVQGTEIPESVCSFFCDDKIATQQDAKAILRSVIYQILRRRRSLLRYVKVAHDIQGSQLIHSFDALWNIFLAITSDPRSGPVTVIVDAIDECEEKTRVRFLDAVTNLVRNARVATNPLPNYVRFLITSRPSPSLSIFYDFSGFSRNRLPLEDNHSGINKDVQLVIERRVEEIVQRSECSPKIKEFLEKDLYSRSGQTFLWVQLVLQCLEKSLLASQKDFQKILSALPQDLEEIYENFLRSIPTQHQNLASTILHILVGSPRYVTLDEMRIMITINVDHRSVAEVDKDGQPSIGRTVQGILGPLVIVSESKISLVHTTAKEFLLDLATRPGHALASTFGVDQVNSALIIASSYISYLLLQDFNEDHFSQQTSRSDNSSDDSPIFGRVGLPDEETYFDPLSLENDTILKDEHVVETELCLSLVDRFKFFDYSATYWAESFSLCEGIAPKDLQDSAILLTTKRSCHLTNWLRYFWLQTGMEFALADDMDSLMLAAFFDQSVLLDSLLQENALYQQSHKDRALFWAARKGCGKTAEILLRNGADPNSRVVDQQTALTVAAQYGHLPVVKVLLANESTDINLKAKSGRSPLSLAAGQGHLSVVRLISNHEGCRPDEQDYSNWNPLMWAIGGNHFDVVSELGDNHPVDINHIDRTGRSAFSWAAGDGLSTLLKYLFRKPQLTPSLQDRGGRCALSWAAGNGHIEAVTVLVKSKRFAALKDVDDRNAISWACEGGHHMVLKILLKVTKPRTPRIR